MTWANIGSGTHNAPPPWLNIDVHEDADVHPDQVVKAGEPLPFPDKSCDRILLSHVLEHIPWEQVPDFLTDIRRVAAGEVLVVGPDTYRVIQSYKDGLEPWSIVTSVIEHKDHPDDMAHWPGAPHHWNCLGGDTEFLTDMGVRTLAGACGEKVRVLASPRGERGAWRSAVVKSFGVQDVQAVTLQRCGRHKVITATPEHRWFVREGSGGRREVITSELSPGDELASCRGHLPGNVRPSPYGIAAGITFGDGTAWSRQLSSPAEVTLCGQKDAELLKFFPLSHTRARPGIGITVCDLPRSWKQLPDLTESLSYLYGWLLGYLAADGHVDERGAISLASARMEHLYAARDVAVRLGVPTGSVATSRPGGFSGIPREPLYQLRFPVGAITPKDFLIEEHRRRARPRTLRPAAWRVEAVESAGSMPVFCVVEPTTHTFTLLDNILTGNCHEARAAMVLQRSGFHAAPVLDHRILEDWPVVQWNPRWQFALICRDSERTLRQVA